MRGDDGVIESSAKHGNNGKRGYLVEELVDMVNVVRPQIGGGKATRQPRSDEARADEVAWRLR
jgi:hypothetical protein